MKKRLFCVIFVITILISVFSVSASAQEVEKYNIDFDLPDEFIVLTEENIKENSDAIKSLGFTNETFKNYINSNHIALFASLNDKSCQITINVNKTKFTENTDSLNYFDDEYIGRILPELLGNKVATNEIKTFNDTKYVVVENKSTDSVGDFSYIQYVTVKNQRLYTITVSFSNANITNENREYTEALIKKLVISVPNEKITMKSVQNVTVYIVLILVIIFLVLVVAYFAYTIVKDILEKKNTSDVAPYVKIKRRRFK